MVPRAARRTAGSASFASVHAHQLRRLPERAASSATSRSSDISEYVSRPDCFVWVALFEPTIDELDEMAEEFDLHELAVEDARHGHQRPKIEEYGDSLFAVLHTIEPRRRRTARRARSRGEVDIFVGPQLRALRPPSHAAGLRAPSARAPSASRSSSSTARASCSTR